MELRFDVPRDTGFWTRSSQPISWLGYRRN